MDLTPLLSRSPVSPPNSYCPSEVSSLDYPSPESVAQHYRLSSSLYGSDSGCSMAPIDSDISLSTLDAMSQPEWGHTLTTHTPPITSTAVPVVLSAEYDPFGGYGSPMSPAYGQDLYAPAHNQVAKPVSLLGSPSPGIAHSRPASLSSSRPGLPFAPPPTSMPSPSLESKGKLEEPMHYTRVMDVAHYSSPRPIQTPYPVEPASIYGTDTNIDITSGYMPGNTPSSVWGPPVSGSEHFFSMSSSIQPQTSDLMPDQQTRNSKLRRPARRLTTKDEANFQCEVKGCGKLFSRSYNYKAHMETHDEKREYPFPCQVSGCNKKFVRKTDLQRHHQSVHMKERNHKCDYCGRLFARKDTLRRHMDDGCSKRFDIGTLDLRTETYSALDGATQEASLWRGR